MGVYVKLNQILLKLILLNVIVNCGLIHNIFISNDLGNSSSHAKTKTTMHIDTCKLPRLRQMYSVLTYISSTGVTIFKIK